MERALNPDLLQLALGDYERLPTVEDFSRALEDAELSLLRGTKQLEETVVPTAWLLHAIASSSRAEQVYGEERRQAAFEVSAHAFDLSLQLGEHDPLARAQRAFAAEIAYLRSNFDPNSIAVYDRELKGRVSAELNLLNNPVRLGLSCATALVAFDTDYLFTATDNVYARLDSLSEQLGIERVDDSPFGAACNLVAGCRDLLIFLVYGREHRLSAAAHRFRRAINPSADVNDRSSQWAAAHLLNILPGLHSSSIWSVLPPEVPRDVRKAFTLAPPRILTLWPPQLELVRGGGEDGGHSPFEEDNDRQLITTPTSGGKTLFAQLIIATHLRQAERGVCYIAPTRSLCREVRQTLNRRLQYVSRNQANHSAQWMDADSTFRADADIEVMTPERLSYLLREDAEAVLERFGLFVFDEVHSVGESSRGWTLEQDLSYLHYATHNRAHRIVLMSAVVGNRPHFVEWMGGEARVSRSHSDWRAPRRTHAIYTTAARWDEAETEPRNSEDWPIRRRVPLDGVLRVRGAEGQIRDLRSKNSIGQLVFRETETGERDKQSEVRP